MPQFSKEAGLDRLIDGRWPKEVTFEELYAMQEYRHFDLRYYSMLRFDASNGWAAYLPDMHGQRFKLSECELALEDVR